MKTKKNILSLIVLFTLLTFTACNSDSNSNDDDNNNNSSDSKITLKIDNGTETVYTNITAAVVGDKIMIGGHDADSDIQIIVDNDISEGTYNNSEIGMTHGVNSLAIFGSVTNMTSLSFIVSSHDTSAKHIKGTFSLNYDDNQNASTHSATGTYNIYYTSL